MVQLKRFPCAAAVAVFITTGWHFHIKNRTNSSTKGFFSEKKYLFWFIADWPCWELSEALPHIMAHHATPHPLPHVAPFTHRTQLSKPAVTYVTVPLAKSKTKLIQSFFKLSYGLCVSWDKPIGFRMNSAWCIKLHMYLHVSVEPSYSN